MIRLNRNVQLVDKNLLSAETDIRQGMYIKTLSALSPCEFKTQMTFLWEKWDLPTVSCFSFFLWGFGKRMFCNWSRSLCSSDRRSVSLARRTHCKMMISYSCKQANTGTATNNETNRHNYKQTNEYRHHYKQTNEYRQNYKQTNKYRQNYKQTNEYRHKCNANKYRHNHKQTNNNRHRQKL